jgi:hypothetical protein
LKHFGKYEILTLVGYGKIHKLLEAHHLHFYPSKGKRKKAIPQNPFFASLFRNWHHLSHKAFQLGVKRVGRACGLWSGMMGSYSYLFIPISDGGLVMEEMEDF